MNTVESRQQSRSASKDHNHMKAVRLGIDTHQEFVLFMRSDCHLCRSEGFLAHSRLEVSYGDASIIATLYQISSDLLATGEAGLSESAWNKLGVLDGEFLSIRHPAPLESSRHIRSKIYGNRLNFSEFSLVTEDILAGRYSDIHLSSFLTACAARPLDLQETIALTKSMINVGETLDWRQSTVVDKHCIGGLPGNRTTPVVVAIVTAAGLTMPKTSSRAITSPAGTADMMETLAPVDLSVEQMREVVSQHGGCIAWGGDVCLSPVDDILIRVERVLDLDSEGQLVASILSKKIAAGSTHLVLDIPVGRTAKIRMDAAGQSLARTFVSVGEALGINVETVLTDGSQPIGRGIGPALEARDVLAVLQSAPDHLRDLREKSVSLAAHLLEMGGAAPNGEGESMALEILHSGQAWRKFQSICEAQGGQRIPGEAPHRHLVTSDRSGMVTTIDNRRIAKTAKLAGAPDAKLAGLFMECQLGDTIIAGEPLFTIHAETPGELSYARDYAARNIQMIEVRES